MLLIDGTFSFATPFCACIFNKHSNALHFILEPGKHLSMIVESEEMLRAVLPILRTEALPTERIAIDYAHYEDWQTHRTRVSGIYQEVLGHEYPENN
jgi:hypothetical protein